MTCARAAGLSTTSTWIFSELCTIVSGLRLHDTHVFFGDFGSSRLAFWLCEHREYRVLGSWISGCKGTAGRDDVLRFCMGAS
jgi:hypothetical protein